MTDPRLTPGVSRDVLGAAVDAGVAHALGNVPRHLFVPEARRMTAYTDRSVPIGQGRRCPRPSLVARMLDACPKRDGRALIVASGTGYVAACVAETAAEVVAIEADPVLAERAAVALGHAGGSDRIVLREKLPPLAALEAKPFDTILVPVSFERSPRRLLGALADDGVLVCGITTDGAPRLFAFQKVARGHLRRDLGGADMEILLPNNPNAC